MRHTLVHQSGLWLHLFGLPHILWYGQRYPLARRQTQALLYYLAVYLQPVTRSQLCQLFWPQENNALARRRLTHLLDDLRRSLPCTDLLHKTDEVVSLNPDLVMSDTVLFMQLAASPSNASDALEQATMLYQDALLSDFALPNHPEFEIWLLGERVAWERCYLAVLARLVKSQADDNQLSQAIRHALCYLHLDAMDEAMHRQLFELYGRIGDRDAVQRQYTWCVRVLLCELGVQPELATEAAYAAALKVRHHS